MIEEYDKLGYSFPHRAGVVIRYCSPELRLLTVHPISSLGITVRGSNTSPDYWKKATESSNLDARFLGLS